MENTTKATPIMTVDEMADYLQLHPLTVRKLAGTGEIPMFKVGRQWRVKRTLLDKWIDEQTRQDSG